MKQTKFKNRVEHAFDVFFDEEPENRAENQLTFAAESGWLEPKKNERLEEKGDVFVKILRRAFLFLPGAFYLFFGVISVLTFDVLKLQPFSVAVMLAIGGLMTIFGLGDIKNPKHLAIPVSIGFFAVAAYLIFSTFGGLGAVFDYGVYFFPPALMAAVLAKNLADKTDEAKSANR